MTTTAINWLVAACITLAPLPPAPDPHFAFIGDGEEDAGQVDLDAEVDAARRRVRLDITDEELERLKDAAAAAAAAMDAARETPDEEHR